jgi:hypothetical protein
MIGHVFFLTVQSCLPALILSSVHVWHPLGPTRKKNINNNNNGEHDDDGEEDDEYIESN